MPRSIKWVKKTRWNREDALTKALAVADKWRNCKARKLPEEVIALKILRAAYSIKRQEYDTLKLTLDSLLTGISAGTPLL